MLLLEVFTTYFIHRKYVQSLQPLHSRYGNKLVLYPMQGVVGLSLDFRRCDLRQRRCMRQRMGTTPYEVGTRLPGCAFASEGLAVAR